MSDFNDKATVSGSVVSIENGADEVGAKSCVVTIPASLSGVSSVTETQTGRNLIDRTDFTRGLPSTTIGASIETITASTRYAYFGTPIKGENYTVSSVSNDTDYFNAILIFGYTNGVLSFYTNATVNASKTVDLSDCDYARIAIGSRTAQITVPTDFTDYGTIQLEYGSTAHAYEPYQTPTTYTASLGRTIHGGQVDIVNGEGQEIYKKVVLDGTQLNRDFGLTAKTGYTQVSYVPYIDEGIGNAQFVSDSFEQVASISQVTEPGKMWNSVVPRLFFSLPETVTTQAQVNAYFAQNPAIIVYPIVTPTDFTFTGQEVPTRLGYNAFWSDSGDTELTYYKSGYGYTSVTVNRTGKNLSPVSEYPTNPWVFWGTNFLLMRDVLNTLRTGTYTISFTFEVNEVPDTNNITYGIPYIRALVNGSYVNLTSYTLTDALGVSVGDKFTSTATFTIDATTVGNVAYCYAYCDKKESHSGTGRGGYNLINVQVEVGSHSSTYVPYETPVTKTAKLHKVIYAGEVDVIKGTAKPKNLIDDNTIYQFASNYITIGGTLQYNYAYFLKAGTYTISLGGVTAYAYIRKQNTTTNTIIKGKDVSNATFTIDEDSYYAFWLYNNTDNISVEDVEFIQIEAGSTKTDYVPHFDPFTFPPISMETDEGENTLFANEGDSAIIYRKQAE